MKHCGAGYLLPSQEVVNPFFAAPFFFGPVVSGCGAVRFGEAAFMGHEDFRKA